MTRSAKHKKKQNRFQKIVSAVLCTTFLTTLLPIQAIADEFTGTKEQVFVSDIQALEKTEYEVLYGTELDEIGLPTELNVHLVTVTEEPIKPAEPTTPSEETKTDSNEESKEESKEESTDSESEPTPDGTESDSDHTGTPFDPAEPDSSSPSAISFTWTDLSYSGLADTSTDSALEVEPSDPTEPTVPDTPEVTEQFQMAAIEWEGVYRAKEAGDYTLTAVFVDETLYYEEMPEVIVTVLPETLEYDSISLTELKNLPEDEAGAATEMEQEGLLFSLFSSFFAIFSEDWSLDVLYVGHDGTHDVTMTKDFNLKYQMNFHSDLDDLEPGTVMIRIPASFYYDRDGNAVLPDDIAVPEGTEGDYHPSGNSPFNYYVDGEDLVFWNYRTIQKGTSTSFQVLYKNQSLMQIVDASEWTLTPEITILHADTELVTDEETGDEVLVKTGTYTEEVREATPLTGRIDSGVTLEKINIIPYNDQSKSYTPGLYTPDQVKRFISGELPALFQGDSFDQYYYSVWKVDASGSATQPWTMAIDHIPTAVGTDGVEVPGILVGTSTIGNQASTVGIVTQNGNIIEADVSMVSDIQYHRFVVVAYPNATLQPGMPLKNKIQVTLHPYDDLDEDQTKEMEAQWGYAEYDWIYPKGIIAVEKSGGPTTLLGWLASYKIATERNEDYGDIPFSVHGYCRGFHLTHSLDKNQSLGTYNPGTYYTVSTADDVIYAYSNHSSMSGKELTDNDYYYSSVTVSVQDKGYDVWEDQYAAPETETTIDRSVNIYAMFSGSDQWTLVDTVDWDPSGNMTYTFPADQLAKEPYRVKAVHHAVDYVTDCYIDVTVRIRHDSPILNAMLQDDPNDGTHIISLQNMGAILGYNHDGQTIHDGEAGPGANYEQYENHDRDLRVISEALYATEYGEVGTWEYRPPQRDNASVAFGDVSTHAEIRKVAKTQNDATHGRVNVTYTLTAYEGYQITNKEDYAYLRTYSLLEVPTRSTVEFYDLLPDGMHLNVATLPKAGRITSLGNGQTSYAGSWDTAQVSVEISDYIENYNNTGRNLVKFRINYAGTDASVYSEAMKMWYDGWGVEFDAYYDWSELLNSQTESNIAAFMPGPGDIKPIIGTEDEVALDNGELIAANTLIIDALKDRSGNNLFGSDINQDGITDIRNVLYAKADILDNIAVATLGELRKYVRADSDIYAQPSNTATVGYGEGYTYTLTSKVSDGTSMKDMVFFDQIESLTAQNKWYGTFRGIDTSDAEKKGATPVIYYSENRETSVLPQNEDTKNNITANLNANEILTESNGWYTEASWQAAGKTVDQVRSIAVRLTNLVIADGQSVSIQIKMAAPTLDDLGNDRSLLYTHNEPHLLATTASSEDGAAVERTYFYDQDPVTVSLKGEDTLEIVKEFADVTKVPSSLQDEEFLFHVTRNNVPFTDKAFVLYELAADGSWKQMPETYGTDAAGVLSLKAGQKAVFENIAGIDEINVTEESRIFWQAEMTESSDAISGVYTKTFKNHYRPPLYVTKKLDSIPSDPTMVVSLDVDDAKTESFTFRVSVYDESSKTYVPFANQSGWLTDSSPTNGQMPNKLGEVVTDSNGCFQMKADQIAAFFMDTQGIKYKVEETDSGENWICTGATTTGTIGKFGSVANITNYYRWKDLIIQKEVTHAPEQPLLMPATLSETQTSQEYGDYFTFQITDENGDPVVGKEWIMLASYGGPASEWDADTESFINYEGTLDENGQFSAPCAGLRVMIRGLEAGKTFTVKEIACGENYAKVNDTAEAVMPIYGTSKTVTITNDYLWRDLKVTKTVLHEGELDATKTFTFTVKNAEGTPMPGISIFYQYRGDGEYWRKDKATDENGQFTMIDGESVILSQIGKKGETFTIEETPDPDYPQISPANGEAASVTLSDEDNVVAFINGMANGTLMIQKDISIDISNISYEDYAADFGTDDVIYEQIPAISAKLYITEADGETYQYPKQTSTITWIDDTGSMTNQTMYPGNNIIFEPGKDVTLLINDMPEDATYQLVEDALWQDFSKSYMTDKYLLHMQAVLGEISGSTNEGGVVALKNNVKVDYFPKGSVYRKEMTPASSPIPDGATLTFRIEYLDPYTFEWVPAEGTQYVLMFEDDLQTNTLKHHYPYEGYLLSGSGSFHADTLSQKYDATKVEILETNENGEITIAAQNGWYPTIYFASTVYANVNLDSLAGEPYRIIEVPEKTDPEWGSLVGYKEETIQGNGDLSLENIQNGSFVNSNEYSIFEVEKSLSNGTMATEEFSFYLHQVNGIHTDIVSGEDYVIYNPIEGFPFTIYNSQTGEEISTGITGKEGLFNLKANQFARFEAPIESSWFVYEGTVANAVLYDVIGNDASCVQIVDYDTPEYTTAALIKVPRTSVFATDLYATIDTPVFSGDTILPDDYVVTGIYSDGTHKQLDPSEYTLATTTVPEGVDSFTQVITITATGERVMCETSVMTVNSITITPDLLTASLYSLDGNEMDVYDEKTNTLTVPELFVSEGTVYRTTGIAASYNTSFSADYPTVETIILPDSLISIGRYAFNDCSSLARINIPNGVTSIGANAFIACSSLKNIDIPDGVTSIGSYTFNGCSSLTSFNIPDGVTSIGENTFYNCESLTNIDIPNSVSSIGPNAFGNCKALSSITIPYGVSSIKEKTFYNCSSLKSINIPDSVTSIGSNAFEGCSALKSITIPDGVTEIGANAFKNCSSLESVHLPYSVTSIGNNAFYGCSSLKSINIPDSVTSIGYNAFYGCSSLKSIHLPDSLTNIGASAFKNCSSLESIHLPDSVTSIGNNAFENCSSLESIHLPDSLTKIDNYTFSKCSSLSSIIIPNSITSIGNYAFSNCASLTTITLPEGLDKIGSGAFRYCTNLGIDSEGTIIIPEGLTKIDSYTFQRCTSLTSINIPSGVTSIDNYAFANCMNLKTVSLNEGLQSIGASAFSYASIENIVIPDSVISIDSYAFNNSQSRTISISPESSLKTIGNNAFHSSLITTITLPKTISSIGENAFAYSDYLTTIIINRAQDSISGSPWGATSATVTWTGTE